MLAVRPGLLLVSRVRHFASQRPPGAPSPPRQHPAVLQPRPVMLWVRRPSRSPLPPRQCPAVLLPRPVLLWVRLPVRGPLPCSVDAPGRGTPLGPRRITRGSRLAGFVAGPRRSFPSMCRSEVVPGTSPESVAVAVEEHSPRCTEAGRPGRKLCPACPLRRLARGAPRLWPGHCGCPGSCARHTARCRCTFSRPWPHRPSACVRGLVTRCRAHRVLGRYRRCPAQSNAGRSGRCAAQRACGRTASSRCFLTSPWAARPLHRRTLEPALRCPLPRRRLGRACTRGCRRSCATRVPLTVAPSWLPPRLRFRRWKGCSRKS